MTMMLISTGLLASILLMGCAEKPMVIDVTRTIPAGQLIDWDVSAFEECRYHFAVRQTGTFGDVDIKFQGQRYTEKDGVFHGDTFTLDNGYSLGTAKVVDLILRCDT